MSDRNLTEANYEQREYFTGSLMGTTDGLFTVPKRRLKTLVMTDSRGGTLVIEFKDKPQE